MIKWPSYDNIHKMFSSKMICDDLLEIIVNFNIKIDGSNLSIHIKKTESKWNIISINGRNCPIWTSDEKLINNITYGSAGFLNNLPNEIFNIATRIGEKMNVDEIIIFGEVFRAKNNKKSANLASWHPFGYYLENNEQSITKLFSVNYFDDICPIPYDIIDFATMIEFLIKTENHSIFPPLCLYSGKLGDGILKLSNLMLTSEKHFEGFFIVIDQENGYKWKTPNHEEQKKILMCNECMFLKENSKNIYKILENIYLEHNKIKNVDEKSVTNKSIDLLTSDILTAFNKLCTKISDFTDLPKKDRLPLIDELIPDIVIEVLKQYTDCDIQPPYSENEIKKKSNNLLKQLIMKF